LATPNPRRALALAAAKFYPRQPRTIAAVTGPAARLRWPPSRARSAAARHASASIGTIGLVSPKRTVYGSLTTPDPIALHRQLDEIAATASPISPLKRPRRARSISARRRARRRRRVTNLSRDHMITIRTWHIISPQSCGCSAISWWLTGLP